MWGSWTKGEERMFLAIIFTGLATMAAAGVVLAVGVGYVVFEGVRAVLP